jgi:single-stranded-DNA-specific exonuclease
LGIVASRIVETYYRPVVLIAVKGELGKGSARKISAAIRWQPV